MSIQSEETNFYTNGEFDLGKFSAAFNKNKQTQKYMTKLNSEKRLNILENENTIHTKKTIADILIEMKNSWFNLIGDLLEQKFEIETFVRNDRLFYIGMTLIILSIILLFFDQFSDS